MRLVTSLVILLFAGTIAAQTANSKPPTIGKTPTATYTVQQQFIPYWTADPGWHTDLMLRNNMSSTSLVVTPVLRLTDGSEVTLPVVAVAPDTVAQVNLRTALAQSDPQVLNLTNPYGSALLEYNAPDHGTLYASAMIYDDGRPIIFHLDGAFLVPGNDRGSREGIWWMPKGTTNGYLVLTNFSGSDQNGILCLYDAAGSSWNESLTLPAKQTVRLPLRDLVAHSSLTGDYGGVSFRMSNGEIIYNYTPPDNSFAYITTCLSGISGSKITGQTSAVPVPAE